MKRKPQGLGGWLILPIFMLFLNTLIFVLDISGVLGTQTGIFLRWAVLIDFIFIVILVIGLFNLFEKKSITPTYLIWVYWMIFLESLTISLISYDFSVTISSLFGAVIWTLYFRNSLRVKNTFIKKNFMWLSGKKPLIFATFVLVILLFYGLYSSNGPEFNTLQFENSKLREGYYASTPFELYYNNNIDLNFNSDNYASIYLLDEENYLLFEDDESYSYIDGIERVKEYSFQGIPLNGGIYYFVVFADRNESIVYNFSIIT